jgi:RsiW-degrading membrane proteinase PrsW (M82 family)
MQDLLVTIYGQTRSFAPEHSITIGSDPHSTIVLNVPAVGGCHLALRAEQGTWVAHDGSASGTYVNGHRVSIIGVDRPIAVRLGSPAGPEVVLAPHEARYVATPPGNARPAAPRIGPATAGRAAVGGIASVTGQLSALWKSAPSLSVLLPLRSWWDSKDWRKGYPLFFLIFALAPYVVFAAVSPDQGIGSVAWAYVGIFSVLWALLFFTLIRPGKLNVTLLGEIAITSAVFGIPLAIWLEQRLPGKSNLAHLILAVGLPEEIAKAAPVFVIMVLLTKGRSYSTRTFMYMGAISGLAFGAVEGVRYISLYQQALVAGQMSPAAFIQVVAMRFFTDSLFHGCTAVVSAYFIGLAARHPMWRIQLMAFGIGTMAVLHGVNDRWASGWPLVAIAATLLFIVIGYVQNGDRIEAEVARVEQLEATPSADVKTATATFPMTFPSVIGGPVPPVAARPLFVPGPYQQVG